MSDQYSDQIFDYFVTEMLDGPEPPDLTERIVGALANQPVEPAAASSSERPSSNLVAAELVVQESQTANTENTNPPATHTKPPPVQLPQAETSEAGQRRAIQILGGIVALIAACLLIVVIGPQFATDSMSDQSTDKVAELPSSGSSDGQGHASADSSPLIAQSGNQPTTESQDNVSTGPALTNSVSPPMLDSQPRESSFAASEGANDSLDLDKLPFEESVASSRAESRTSSGNSPEELSALPASEIVSQFDETLEQAWQDFGITPAPLLSPQERVTRILTLANLTPETLVRDSRFDRLSASTNDSLVKLTEAVVSESTFAKRFARNLVRRWLKRSALPTEDQSTDALQSYVRRAIATDQNWNEVVAEIVGGQLRFSQDDPSSSTPAGVFATALSDKDNHRYLSRIGSIFLDTNLQCIRCHDAMSPIASGDSTDAFAQAFSNQETYWALRGLLEGIRAEGNGYQGQRILKDEQRGLKDLAGRELYYDLPDGMVAVTKPSIPGYSNWAETLAPQPRKALAKWLVQSKITDRSIVNETWQQVFGRRLVAQNGELDLVAIGPRQETLRFLTEQFVAHGRSVRKLTSWLAASDTFARKALPLDRIQWASMTKDQLAELQIREQSFAAGQVLGQSSEAGNLERSLSYVMEFDQDLLERTQALAQINPTGKQAKETKIKDSPKSSPSYLLYGQLSTPAESAYLEAIDQSSSLDWSGKVAHVVLLSRYEAQSSKTMDIADRLLEHHSQDSAAALQTLLWSVKNTEASR
ncbi:MAG: DUF1553 domain-containing protein [Pirellulaceae bacterium]